MGWSNGTQVFDAVADHVLDPSKMPEPLAKQTLKDLLKELGDLDWDTIEESTYFHHSVVQQCLKELWPHIYGKADVTYLPEQRFHVVWEIDVYAKTPREAAEQAFNHIQRPGTPANYFEVFDQDGHKVCVDLSEEEDE